MVDVSAKPVTERVCVARGEVRMAAGTLDRIAAGDLPKGDVLATARIAGIQAAKRTSEWIPLCHPVGLDSLEVDLTPDARAACLRIEARARAQGIKTLFVLTTRTAHWFRERGFEPSSVERMPTARASLYNYQRNSKVFEKTL